MGIFSFLKRQKADRQSAKLQASDAVTTSATEDGAPEQNSSYIEEPGLDQKIKRTRSKFTDNLLGFLRGKKKVDDELLE